VPRPARSGRRRAANAADRLLVDPRRAERGQEVVPAAPNDVRVVRLQLRGQGHVDFGRGAGVADAHLVAPQEQAAAAAIDRARSATGGRAAAHSGPHASSPRRGAAVAASTARPSGVVRSPAVVAKSPVARFRSCSCLPQSGSARPSPHSPRNGATGAFKRKQRLAAGRRNRVAQLRRARAHSSMSRSRPPAPDRAPRARRFRRGGQQPLRPTSACQRSTACRPATASAPQTHLSRPCASVAGPPPAVSASARQHVVAAQRVGGLLQQLAAALYARAQAPGQLLVLARRPSTLSSWIAVSRCPARRWSAA